MALDWKRVSANTWVAGDYTITRHWLHDGQRGRRYEVRYPNGATDVFTGIAKAKEFCRIHAALVELHRQLLAASGEWVETWRAALADLAAATQQIAERLKDALVRR